MSSVLHPVGPEEPRTYWVRRAIVVGGLMLAVIVVIAIIVSQTSSGSVVAQPTPSALDPSPPAASTPTYTPTPSTTPTSVEDPADRAATRATPSTSSPAEASTTAEPSASPSTRAAPAACPAGDLRATLTGKQRLRPKQANVFTISLINGSGASCRVSITSDTFELKIYSGRDRIWSTADCARSVKAVSKKLAKEQSVEWKLTWDGSRSRAACKQRPEIPQAGTYFATAQFTGAKPVQLRMVLHG